VRSRVAPAKLESKLDAWVEQTTAARIGYNRRCCWADGTHTMHGDTRRGDFTGLEGPDDPSHLALFALDASGEPMARFTVSRSFEKSNGL